MDVMKVKKGDEILCLNDYKVYMVYAIDKDNYLWAKDDDGNSKWLSPKEWMVYNFANYSYIGNVESEKKVKQIMANHANVAVTGITAKGEYELSVNSKNDRVITMFQSALARNRL